MDDARALWLADPLFAPAIEHVDVAGRLRAMTADYDGAHWRGEASTTYESAEPPSRARLTELSCETLVAVGDRDLATFRAMADDYATALPRARRIVISGAGHVSSLEAADAFNTAVSDFLEIGRERESKVSS